MNNDNHYNQSMEQIDSLLVDKLKKWLGTGSINIFGRPFSGKDTQGKKLAKLFDAPLIGGGDILRASNIPQDIKDIMSKGELIPTQAYIDIVLPYLSQEDLKGKPIILSSVGRWQGEELGVMEALELANHPLKAVIYLDIDEDDVSERWEIAQTLGDRGRRADDAHGTLSTRLKEFREKTIPVIQHYDDSKLLIKINGNPSEEIIFKNILDSLDSLT